MKKFNYDVLCKILILLGFSIFFLKLVVSNDIVTFVHPRIIPFVCIGIVLMVITVFYLIKAIFINGPRKFMIKNYIFFIIPILLTVIYYVISYQVKDVTNNPVSDVSSSVNIVDPQPSDFYLYSGKTENDGSGTAMKVELDIEDNIIKINSKNFVVSLDELINNPAKYDGNEIQIDGFVYNDEKLNLNSNQFIIARYLMVCCAADLQIAGLRCECNNADSYSLGTWVKISGKIKNDTYEDMPDPIIIIENIEKEDNPDTSYVYPY